jgi:WD40 repeat protein
LIHEGTGWVRFVEFSPDGHRIFVGGETYGWQTPSFQGAVCAYNVADGNLIKTWPTPDRVMCGAISADGRWRAAAIGLGTSMPPGDDSSDNTLIVWDTSSGEQLASFNRDQSQPFSLSFSPDGAKWWLVSEDKTLRRWDWREGKENAPPIKFPAIGDGSGYFSGIVSGGAAFIAFGGQQVIAQVPLGRLTAVRLDDVTKRWEQAFAAHRPSVYAISPDGRMLAVYLQRLWRSKATSRLALLSTEGGVELADYELPDNAVRSLTFSPDSARLAAGMELGDALIWDVSDIAQGLQ